MKEKEANKRLDLCRTMLTISTLLVALGITDKYVFSLFIVSAIFYYSVIIFKWDEIIPSMFNLTTILMSIFLSALISILIGIGSANVFIALTYYVILSILFSLLFLPPRVVKSVVNLLRKKINRKRRKELVLRQKKN